jgi:hypothetical protein
MSRLIDDFSVIYLNVAALGDIFNYWFPESFLLVLRWPLMVDLRASRFANNGSIVLSKA